MIFYAQKKMQPSRTRKFCKIILSSYSLLCFFIAWMVCSNVYAMESANATNLQAKYSEITKQLNNNQFKRELFLQSADSSHDLKGDIYAVVNYPFATVNSALNNPAHWCDVLILHINVKFCGATKTANPLLTVNLGKKFDQPLADAYEVKFNYFEMANTADYFAIELNAKNGPLNTHDYRIWIEATPLKNGRTFLHFSYAYAFGLAGRLAMQSYLATSGREKVGFTVENQSQRNNEQLQYIKGVRGVIERNTMRYFLAIDAYLNALKLPPADQLEERLQSWYSGSENYARQLHEVERNEYLEMKRKEYKRQQIVP